MLRMCEASLFPREKTVVTGKWFLCFANGIVANLRAKGSVCWWRSYQEASGVWPRKVFWGDLNRTAFCKKRRCGGCRHVGGLPHRRRQSHSVSSASKILTTWLNIIASRNESWRAGGGAPIRKCNYKGRDGEESLVWKISNIGQPFGFAPFATVIRVDRSTTIGCHSHISMEKDMGLPSFLGRIITFAWYPCPWRRRTTALASGAPSKMGGNSIMLTLRFSRGS